ncbi:hypothetical protein HDU67_010343 [Dinochytrium kinnereticum]|nr:hypothetical protein HDU67_010343 [Dinochytrium kinnereticum]
MTSPIDPTPVLELINAFRKSKIMFTLVTTGIIDILDTHGPIPSSEIVQKMSPAFNVDAVDRILRASVPLGLVSVEGSTRKFRLTPVSKVYLSSNSEKSMADKTLYPLWNALPSSLETGQPAWTEAFPSLFPSSSAQNPFSKLYADTDSRLRFQDAMHSHAVLSAPSIVSSLPNFDWASIAVDLGGATGALAVELVIQRPYLSCKVVDLPDVVKTAKERYLVSDRVKGLLKQREAAGIGAEEVLQKVEAVEGDFFTGLEKYMEGSSAEIETKDDLPHGDIYLLSRILHDWNDTQSLALLKRVYNLLPTTSKTSNNVCGAIVIAETLLDDETLAGPVGSCLQDINMLVQTGGRERSSDQFRSMLEEAGFKDIVSVRTGSYLDVVVGYKLG